MQKRKEVYKLTDVAEIRFKPQSVTKTVATQKLNEVKGWTHKLIQMVSQRVFKPAKAEAVGHTAKPHKGSVVDLTLAAYLNPELLLVGNSSKLDLIHMDVNKDEGEIDVRLVAEFFPSYLVKQILIQRKKQFVLFSGDHHIELYVLDSKSQHLVKKFIHYSHEEIMGVQLVGDNCLLEFHNSHVNILGLENWHPQVIQRLEYNVPSPSYKVFRIPSCTENYTNIFFLDEAQLLQADDSDPITLYNMKIVHENSEFTISEAVRFYELEKCQLKILEISSFDINTVLFNFGPNMTVIKNHYPIDGLTISYKDAHSKLHFLENRNILHICDSMLENYSLEVFPNYADVKCFDCISFARPPNSTLLAALSLQDDKVILVYKLNNRQNTTETRYWITTTIETSIKIKLEALFKRTKVPNEVLEAAQNMGMSRNEIFYQLWMQSPRKRKEDFDILLQSEDYKIITEGVKSVLKKESISFKELERIEKVCFEMLEKQVNQRPTETTIVQFLKCFFSLRKYSVQRSLQTEKKKRKNAQTDSPTSSQVQLSIQQYQDIRKRNIKSYMLQLMKRSDPYSVLVIKYMVSEFRLTFRYIFPNFLREIVTQLKVKMYDLLYVYPELLPLPRSESGKPYGEAHGVWADILKEEWEDNIYFENLQNIDNVHILEQLMTKDYFKWDWLVEHDFFKIKRAEFEALFLENRTRGIFYIFFEELFNQLTVESDPEAEEAIDEIVRLVENKYPIPEHLVGKTKLYWELHKFFKRAIPEYCHTFEHFLSLKEDEIYRIIFSKNKKALVLKEIKSIYNNVCPPEVYDESILCYFKADYSSLADLKYLLNRVNSEKEEFHNRNQNLYRILIEAAHYKLRWERDEELPLNEVIVYYENILLKTEELGKLGRIQKIDKYVGLFEKLDLDMNLRQFFDEGLEVLNRVAEYFISTLPSPHLNIDKTSGDEPSFTEILNDLNLIRDNLFEINGIDDQKILEILISNCLNFDDYIADVQAILQDSKLLRRFNRTNFQSFLERIIIQKVNKAFMAQSNFESHETYINSMLSLLEEDSSVRQELYAHLQLGLLLSQLSSPPKAPLIVSIRFIEGILQNQSTAKVKSLDIERIYNYMVMMGVKEPITNLYEVLIIKYLSEGEWNEAINYTQLWNRCNQSVVFSATVMLKLAEELPRDLRPLLVDIVVININNPERVLELSAKIIDTSDSKDRRRLIESEIKMGESCSQETYEDNHMLNREFKDLELSKSSEFIKTLYDDMRKVDIEIQNNDIYYMYYRLLMCNPLLASEFHSKNFEFIDMKVQKTLICELSKKVFEQEQYLLDRTELFLYMYRCLLVLYSSNYLSKQFQLGTLLRMPLEEIESKYEDIFRQLHEAMMEFGELSKLALMRFYRKLYFKSVDNLSVNHFDMSDEEDANKINPTRLPTSSTKVIPYKTKKSLYQIIPIEADDRKINTYNTIHEGLLTVGNRKITHHNMMTKSLRNSYKVPSDSELLEKIPQMTVGKSTYQGRIVDRDDISPSKSRDTYEEFNNLLDSENDEPPAEEVPINETMRDEEESDSQTRQRHQVDQVRPRNSYNFKEVKEKNYEDSNENSKVGSEEDSHVDGQRDNNKDVMIGVEEDSILNLNESKQSLHNNKEEENVDQKVSIINDENPISSKKPLEVHFLTRPRSAESREGDADEDGRLSKPVSGHKSNPNMGSINNEERMQTLNDLEYLQRENSLGVERLKKKSSGGDNNESLSGRLSGQFSNTPHTERQLPTFYDHSKLENSELSLAPYRFQEKDIYTINIKDQSNLIESQKVELETNEVDPRIAEAIVDRGDYSLLLEEINKDLQDELELLQKVVRHVYDSTTFMKFIEIVEKLRSFNPRFQGFVKAQNLRVIKNAYSKLEKMEINFDLKEIFTPEVLYVSSSQPNDIEGNNKLIFKQLKPKIIEVVDSLNVFIIAKVMYLSLHFNKSFEFRVQYYYLEKLFRELLAKDTHEEIGMDIEKILAMLSKLPVNMTIERIDKMLNPLMEHGKPESLRLLLGTLVTALDQKVGTGEGDKYLGDIEACKRSIEDRLQGLQNRLLQTA